MIYKTTTGGLRLVFRISGFKIYVLILMICFNTNDMF